MYTDPAMRFDRRRLLGAAAAQWALLGLARAGQGPDNQLAAFKLMHSFDGVDGSYPSCTLLLGSDGKIYGTTASGGIADQGIVFRMTPGGQLTVLHRFNGHDGSASVGGLIQGRDGNYYGTTVGRGKLRHGTVYRMAASGKVTTLHSFALDGSEGHGPRAGLVQAADGDFYGTTSGGPRRTEMGSVFKLSPDGVFTLLHLFDDTSVHGLMPSYGPLIQGDDGDFYGTTVHGGNLPRGKAYKITADGTMTVLHSFKKGSWSGLTDGHDGFFYGLAASDTGELDTAYRMSADGTMTTLHEFRGGRHDGSYTTGELLLGRDGNFYGVTFEGGKNDAGTVYQMTRGGEVTVLYSFEHTLQGGYWTPDKGLIEVGDGEFFGTTRYGGEHGFGTVYRVRLK